jgi:hypothetical protein
MTTMRRRARRADAQPSGVSCWFPFFAAMADAIDVLEASLRAGLAVRHLAAADAKR